MLSAACSCGIAFLSWVMPEEAALELVSSRLLDAALVPMLRLFYATFWGARISPERWQREQTRRTS
jgi:hypothetical protein